NRLSAVSPRIGPRGQFCQRYANLKSQWSQIDAMPTSATPAKVMRIAITHGLSPLPSATRTRLRALPPRRNSDRRFGLRYLKPKSPWSRTDARRRSVPHSKLMHIAITHGQSLFPSVTRKPLRALHPRKDRFRRFGLRYSQPSRTNARRTPAPDSKRMRVAITHGQNLFPSVMQKPLRALRPRKDRCRRFCPFCRSATARWPPLAETRRLPR